MSKDQTPLLTALRTAAYNAAQSGMLKHAQDIQLRALRLTERLYGRNSVEYAQCCEQLGEILLAAGDWQTAEKWLTESLEVLRLVLDGKDTRLGIPLRSLAEVLRQQGRVLEAKCLDSEAASLVRRRLAL